MTTQKLARGNHRGRQRLKIQPNRTEFGLPSLWSQPVIAIDDDPTVTVRLTEPEAISNLRIVLELCASRTLRCSQKTKRPTPRPCAASHCLAAGQFNPHDPIAAYAWPLLTQAGNLGELVGNRLQLTTRGRTAP